MSKSKTAGIALVIAAAVGAALWYVNDEAPVSVVAELEARTSRALGTRVDISESDIDWSEGRVSLSGITVANPGGFSKNDMMTAEEVEIQGDLAERKVQSIAFRGMTAAIEFRGSNSNFESLSDSIEDASESGDGASAAEDTGEKETKTSDADEDEADRSGEPDDKWTVERVAFGPIKVSVRADWTSKTVSLETEGFEVEGLDGDGDRLARAATIEFLGGVLEQAAARAEDDRLRELLLDKAAEVRERMPKTK